MGKCAILLLQLTMGLSLIVKPVDTIGQVRLEGAIAEIARQINGRVGVYALVIETGDMVSYHGEDKFPMQSVYKFPIGMAVLDQVDEGRLALDQIIRVETSDYIPDNGHSPLRDKYPKGTTMTVRQLLNYSVTESDGSASDVLLRLLGGISKAQEYVHNLGISDIAIATTEQVQVADDLIQYQSWATPRAMSLLFKVFYFDDVLSEDSKAFLLQLLSPTGPWFSRRIKGLLPEGITVFHKTGTSGTIDGLTRATNDAGIMVLPDGKHIALSVFITDSYASQQERELAIAKVARAVYDYYTNPGI